MLDLAFNMSIDKEKRENAMNNLLVLARERAGAEEIFNEGGVSKITKLLKIENNKKVTCSAIRIIAELCTNNISRTESIIRDIGVPWCLEMMNSKQQERVNASQYCLQVNMQIQSSGIYVIVFIIEDIILYFDFRSY